VTQWGQLRIVLTIRARSRACRTRRRSAVILAKFKDGLPFAHLGEKGFWIELVIGALRHRSLHYSDELTLANSVITAQLIKAWPTALELGSMSAPGHSRRFGREPRTSALPL
jgi:hypothetical protein